MLLASPASVWSPPLQGPHWLFCLNVPYSWRNQTKSVLMAQSQGSYSTLLTVLSF